MLAARVKRNTLTGPACPLATAPIRPYVTVRPGRSVGSEEQAALVIATFFLWAARSTAHLWGEPSAWARLLKEGL